MKPLTQEEINEQYAETLKLIDEEQIRVKLWANDNGYQVHTSLHPIIKRYRDELKAHMQVLRMNIE